MDNTNIGIFIKDLRKNKHLSQGEVAKVCNVTNQAVSKWERGISIPDIGALQKLSSLYSVTINEILNGKYEEKAVIDFKASEVIMIILAILQFIIFFLPFTSNYRLPSFDIIIVNGYQLVFYGIDGGEPVSAQIILGILIFMFVYIILASAKLLKKNITFFVSMLGLSVLSVVFLLLFKSRYSNHVEATINILIFLNLLMISLEIFELKNLNYAQKEIFKKLMTSKGILGISSLLYGLLLIPFIGSFKYTNFELEFGMIYIPILLTIIGVFIFAKDKFYLNKYNPITLLSVSPITFIAISLYYYLLEPYTEFPYQLSLMLMVTILPVIAVSFSRENTLYEEIEQSKTEE